MSPLRLKLLVLFAFTIAAHGQTSKPTAADTLPTFGKYLVETCSLTSLKPPSFDCNKKSQTITITCKTGANFGQKCGDSIDAKEHFRVNASSSSLLGVNLSVSAGASQTSTPSEYEVTGPDEVHVVATQDGDKDYAAALKQELVIKVAGSTKSSSPNTCPLLPPPPASSSSSPEVDLQSIVNLVGSPTPFVLQVQGKTSILIYSTRFFDVRKEPQKSILEQVLAAIKNAADLLSSSSDPSTSAKAFQVELAIPHASALGDLATKISGLNFSDFTVQNVGSDRVRIKSSTQPKCDTWTTFLTDIRHLTWHLHPEPLELRLFFLTAPDVATAFTNLAPAPSPSGQTGSPSGNSNSPPSSPAASQTPSTATGSPGANSSNATISVTQPPGSKLEIKSDTTPCVEAGLAFGNGNACAPSSGTTGPSGASGLSGATGANGASGSSGAPAATPKPATPIGMASVPTTTVTGQPAFSDQLVFSDTNPGDDAAVVERKRILAMLDLPRPEMIINAWVMQNSSVNPRAMGVFKRTIQDLVQEYNRAIDELVYRAWEHVDQRTRTPGYFDDTFYHYISDQYVGDTYVESTSTDATPSAQRFLETSPARLADSPGTRTKSFGICAPDRYCLGYTTLFQPLRPRLTEVLLALYAAADPAKEIAATIDYVEKPRPPQAEKGHECDARNDPVRRDRCRKLWVSLGLNSVDDSTCLTQDYRAILATFMTDPETGRPHVRMHLGCFLQFLQASPPQRIFTIRSAMADFLFNYKLSQQYPHEFFAYDLSQSADSLNNVFSRMIEAFNRDVVAFQTFMQTDIANEVLRANNEVDQRCCIKLLFGLDKPSFFNDGIVTVRTVSGQATTVGTTSQSALDSSSAPTLSTLLSSIANPGAASTTSSPLAAALGAGAQAPVSLLAGILSAYQSSSVQIGRQLNLQVTPRSLSAASTAELTVSLNADETANGPTYSGPATQNTSRVASHDVTTRVRVESLRLFELSSFSAILQRSRSRFPLLPPFVEIPYIGTIIGVPIPGAKEYHSSTAVISAMAVPTATDIAYGLQFAFDQVVDTDPAMSGGAKTCTYLRDPAGADTQCRLRRAVSMTDLNKEPIRTFHKAMIRCFATNMASPYSSFDALTQQNKAACEKLTFDRVPRTAY